MFSGFSEARSDFAGANANIRLQRRGNNDAPAEQALRFRNRLALVGLIFELPVAGQAEVAASSAVHSFVCCAAEDAPEGLVNKW